MFRSIRLVALLALLGLVGCNPFSDAAIRKMVPGGNIGSGQLECWLTLEFKSYPKGTDLRDVRVRFTSIALEEPAEFDWNYIASRDVLSKGARFGSGHQPFEASTPGDDPPLGQELKVKFPLRARQRIENVPDTLKLQATLYWGGKEQASMRRTIEHVYETES